MLSSAKRLRHFIHRFDSSLNGYVHFHVCVMGGLFAAVAVEGNDDATPRTSLPGVVFYLASAQVQADLRRRILRAFVRWGLLESYDAKDMLVCQRSGFSGDAGVC